MTLDGCKLEARAGATVGMTAHATQVDPMIGTGCGSFTFICLRVFLIFPVGSNGNLSLLEICFIYVFIFHGLKQMPV